MTAPPASGSDLAAQVIAAASDAFIAIDHEGVIPDWNPAAEAMFGWTAEEAVGSSLAETIIPPGLRSAHRRAWPASSRTGVPNVMGQRLELTALHRDGDELPIEMTIWPAEVDGALRFRAFVHDISDRCGAPATCEAHNAVARALAGADSLADGLLGGVRALGRPLGWDVGAYWHLDSPTGRRSRRGHLARGRRAPTRVRAAHARAAPAAGRRPARAACCRPARSPGSRTSRAGGFPRSAASAASGLRTAVACPSRDSPASAACSSSSPARQSSPTTELLEVLEASCTVVGQFVERCTAARELAAAHAAALEGSRLKSEFLANTSHEIRTPLNGVIGMTDLLLPHGAHAGAARVRRDGHARRRSRCSRVINDILDFSKIEAGKLELDDADFALRDVVEDAVATVRPSRRTRRASSSSTWIDPSVPARRARRRRAGCARCSSTSSPTRSSSPRPARSS